MSWLQLEGQVCVVTGAAGGLGRAIVRGFLEAGAKVGMLDRNPADTESFAAEFGVSEDRLSVQACDIGDAEAVEAAFAKIHGKLGAVSVLVNNAAMSTPKPLLELDAAHWDAQMRVNLTGAIFCAQAFHRHSEEGASNRSIVNIASIGGTNAQANSAAYSTSKAAMRMLSQQMALEWGPLGVRVNTVSPGLFITPISAKFYEKPEDKARREQVVPLKRIGDPDELANTVLFLASPRASYVHGAELIVDGGFTKTLMSHIPRPYAKG